MSHQSQITNHRSLSVVLAIRNEEKNLDECLGSVKDIAGEIVVVDEKSTDASVSIAKKYNAKVIEVEHQENFHLNKKLAIDSASGDWTLQLDADERVTPKLSEEIKEVIKMNYKEITNRQFPSDKKKKLFERHQRLIEKREGGLGKKTGEVVAFFIPRLNYFLGKPLRYAGVYPDGVIRLFKKGKARLPAKSVHETMQVDGEVAWLFNDLEHHDSPTFERYIKRANRYTDLTANDLEEKKVSIDIINLLHYSFTKPLYYFLKLYIFHKGFMDGMRGFVWSFYSAAHFPIAYFKYYQKVKG